MTVSVAPSPAAFENGDVDFDIVVVFDYFRSATPLLCLIHALAGRFRIGLYVVPLSADLRAKAGDAQDRFVEACRQAGAVPVEGRGRRCRLMIVQQRPYTDEAVRDVLAAVRPDRTAGLMLLAMAGLDVHDAFVRQFGIDKVYVPNRRFTDFLLETRGARAAYDGVGIEQVGLPYRRVVLEPAFAADWVVASPTTFSFRRDAHVHAFLNTVLALLDRIDPGDRVVYKPHNSDRRDYLAPPRYRAAARWLARLPGIGRITAPASRLPGVVGRMSAKLHTALLHDRVLKRCIPLADLTDRDWLAFEAFLPGVRKGVIGGLSNTIWGTLYYGLPFYNCVDVDARDAAAPGPGTRQDRSRLFLDVNLRFFGVPCCHGRLDSPAARGCGIVLPEDREGDLIDAVVRDVEDAAKRREARA